MKILLHFRWPNLVIILMTQYLLYYKLIAPAEVLLYGSPHKSLTEFLLISLMTILICVAGYISNDLYDSATDAINKKEETLKTHEIQQVKAWLVYGLLNFIGIAVSIWLDRQIGKPFYIMIGLATIILLHFYNRYWKGWVLIGNLAVAFLSMLVAVIILGPYFDFPKFPMLLTISIASYLYFSFFISLIREIVKDIEDVEGDRIAGHKTLPIKWGIPKAIQLLMLITILCILPLFAASIYFIWTQEFILFSWIAIGLITPLCYCFYQLSTLSTKANFTKLSAQIKWIMLSGLIFLLPLSYYLQNA